MSNFVSAEWVNQKVDEDDIVIFDCRFSLAEPEIGNELYKIDHIKGAYYADLNKHLSRPVSTHGGRHPLPSVNILSQYLSRCGVDSEKIVVLYDDQSGSMAARFWWLLKYLGHDRVFVMQGGYTHYKENGYSISSKMPVEKLTKFKPNINEKMVISKDELLSLINHDESILIDAREPNRFKGLAEPIDHKAGHIPSAINIPWAAHFKTPGWWKDKEDLEKDYQDYLSKKLKPVVYCGSGVTACVNVLAMDEAGVKDTVLYAGSWSDWISYPDNRIETESK
jgi:thiosulfate/3-mercaptopyruvate sulfurtransferase